MNLTSTYEDAGLTPSLAQWVKDLHCCELWYRSHSLDLARYSPKKQKKIKYNKHLAVKHIHMKAVSALEKIRLDFSFSVKN